MGGASRFESGPRSKLFEEETGMAYIYVCRHCQAELLRSKNAPDTTLVFQSLCVDCFKQYHDDDQWWRPVVTNEKTA